MRPSALSRRDKKVRHQFHVILTGRFTDSICRNMLIPWEETVGEEEMLILHYLLECDYFTPTSVRQYLIRRGISQSMVQRHKALTKMFPEPNPRVRLIFE